MDWEAVFHGSRRRVSTVIIGGEVDFWSRKAISKEQWAVIQRNTPYDCKLKQSQNRDPTRPSINNIAFAVVGRGF